MSFGQLFIPVGILAVYCTWLAWAHIKGWGREKVAKTDDDGQIPLRVSKDQSQAFDPQDQASLFGFWKDFIENRQWEFIVAGIFVLLVIYSIIFAPARLTGEIPSSPLQPGRPFYNLRWQRNFLNDHSENIGAWIAFFGSFISLLILVFSQIRKQPTFIKIGLLFIALTLAGVGQWLVGNDFVIHGAGFYALSLFSMGIWAWFARDRIKEDLTNNVDFSPALEILALLGIIGLATFARTHALEYVPYGIEGDESKWIYEVVSVMVDGRPDSSGEYHRDALPLSFYMQMPFQRWLGLGILSARIAVVAYSILGTIGFYWLMKQIAPLPIAFMAAFFLSISVMDISASRLANVESHVKLWPILTLALLALGSHKGKWEIYSLSGLALTFGLLTYDTVWPMAAVTLLLALIDFYTHRLEIQAAALRLAALIFPSLLSLPLLIPYAVSRFRYYKLDEKGWQADIWLTLRNQFGDVLQSWFVNSRSDFIYNRDGPLLNAIFIPLLVLGTFIAILHLRHKISHWMIIWAALIIFPVPVIAATPLGRVYYPALPAIYGLIALGSYILILETIRLLGSSLMPLVTVLGLSILVWLPLFNMFIYFNEVGDPKDRQIRRELGEMAQLKRHRTSHLYLPYYPGVNDPLFVETQIVELYLRKQVSKKEVSKIYETIPYDEFLPKLAKNLETWDQIIVILDKHSSSQKEIRNLVADTLFQCFPGGERIQGQFFDRYLLNSSALQEPYCFPVNLHISLSDPLSDSDFPAINWSLSNGKASVLHLLCDQWSDNIFQIEAEDFNKGPGWMQDMAFVDGWTGQGYLADNYGSQTASYSLDLAEPTRVYAWVRYYKREEDDFPAYLKLDDQSQPFSDVSSDDLNRWIWEPIGQFDLTNGKNVWTISRPYDGQTNKFMALFIDTFIFSTNPDFTPGVDTIWETTINKAYQLTESYDQGIIPLELAPGSYRCKVSVESDRPLVNSYGESPVSSKPIEINILE